MIVFGNMESLAKRVSSVSKKLNQTLKEEFPLGCKVCVCYSGGIDSSVLLDICVKHLDKKYKLSAIHINHNIIKEAKQWVTHCQDTCKKLKVGLTVVDVKVNPNKPSLEERARKARLNAYQNHDAQVFLMAHHADDQAETILMRVFRGSSIYGLSGMQTFDTLPGSENKFILRPLLNIYQEEIKEYAKKHKIKFIEDPSNQDNDHNRNWLRNVVLKEAKQRFPGASIAINQVANLAHELAQNEKTTAELDNITCKVVNGKYERTKLQSYGRYRISAWLLYLLRENNVTNPSHRHLTEAVRQIEKCDNFTQKFGEFIVIGTKKYITVRPIKSGEIDKIDISKIPQEE